MRWPVDMSVNDFWKNSKLVKKDMNNAIKEKIPLYSLAAQENLDIIRQISWNNYKNWFESQKYPSNNFYTFMYSNVGDIGPNKSGNSLLQNLLTDDEISSINDTKSKKNKK